MSDHNVTVTSKLEDAGTPDERRRVDRITFTCTADEYSSCRTYPTCDCELFTVSGSDPWKDEAGHPVVNGQPCWLADWFDAEGAVYCGADYDDMRDDYVPAVDRSGPIMTSWTGDCPEWQWEPVPVSADSGTGDDS